MNQSAADIEQLRLEFEQAKREFEQAKRQLNRVKREFSRANTEAWLAKHKDLPSRRPDGRIADHVMAILYGHPTHVLKQMLETHESFIQYALVQGWLEDIPDKEQCISAIKSELARRGGLE